MKAALRLTDLHPSPDDITGDVLAGLSQTPKRLPSKYFYDRRGSELFERITQQPEYYLTRIELALLKASGAEIAAEVGPRAHIIILIISTRNVIKPFRIAQVPVYCV